MLGEAGRSFESFGHGGGRYAASVRASDPGVYLDGAASIPAGFVVCASHREVGSSGAGPLFCMRREAEGWRFGVALDGSTTWLREGALDDCVTCHSSALRDSLFGLP